MIETVSEVAAVSEALEQLRKICRQNGGPIDVFKASPARSCDSTLEEDISPWIKNYRENVYYKKIKSFQAKMKGADSHSHKRDICKAKILLSKSGRKTDVKKLVLLYGLGMRGIDIREVMGVTRGWYNNTVLSRIGRQGTRRQVLDIDTAALKLKELLREEGRL